MRNRELLSISGSRVRGGWCEQKMGWGGGETRLAIFYFFREKRYVSRGIFGDMILFTKMGWLTPLNIVLCDV